MPTFRVGATGQALARAALRGVLLAGGVIAGILLGSGLASAATDDVDSGQAAGAPLLTLGTSLTAPAGRPLVAVSAGVTQAVSVVTPPVLPELEVAVPPVGLTASAKQPTDTGQQSSAAPVPVVATRPVAVQPRRVVEPGGRVVEPVPVPAQRLTDGARPVGPHASAGAAGRSDEPVPAPSPQPPDPRPIRADMPCAPAPAPPAPASQPSTVNAVEAVPADEPDKGCTRVRVQRGHGDRPISIAEEPGSTPD